MYYGFKRRVRTTRESSPSDRQKYTTTDILFFFKLKFLNNHSRYKKATFIFWKLTDFQASLHVVAIRNLDFSLKSIVWKKGQILPLEIAHFQHFWSFKKIQNYEGLKQPALTFGVSLEKSCPCLSFGTLWYFVWPLLWTQPPLENVASFYHPSKYSFQSWVIKLSLTLNRPPTKKERLSGLFLTRLTGQNQWYLLHNTQ